MTLQSKIQIFPKKLLKGLSENLNSLESFSVSFLNWLALHCLSQIIHQKLKIKDALWWKIWFLKEVFSEFERGEKYESRERVESSGILFNGSRYIISPRGLV